MRPGGGKQKGAAFERLICKQLSLWVSAGKSQDCFWRSAMSGGRATVSARKGKLLPRQAGDITATSPEGHALTDWFYVECKSLRDISLDSFLFGTGKLVPIWDVAIREAVKHKREPMLIVKERGRPPIVIVSSGIIFDITDLNDVTTIYVNNPKHACTIYLLQDLLDLKFSYVLGV